MLAVSRRELNLLVWNKAWVRTGGKLEDERNHSGEKEKFYRRTMHMMDMDGFILRTMSGFDREKSNFYEIIKYYPHSIGALYQVALVLRDILNSGENFLWCSGRWNNIGQ